MISWSVLRFGISTTLLYSLVIESDASVNGLIGGYKLYKNDYIGGSSFDMNLFDGNGGYGNKFNDFIGVPYFSQYSVAPISKCFLYSGWERMYSTAYFIASSVFST